MAIMWGETRSSTHQHSSKNLLVILIAATAGFAIVHTAVLGNKWMVATAVGLMALFSFLAITRNYRRFLHLCLVGTLPIRLDFHLIFKETPVAQLKGLPVTLFDLVFVALFVDWLVRLLVGQKRLRLFPSISIPALVYILLAGLSAFKSHDLALSFSMLALIIKGYLIFLYLANNIEDKNEILLILFVLSLGLLLQSFLGILQFLTGKALGSNMFGQGEQSMLRTVSVGYAVVSRVNGTIGDPNSLAMYMNFFLPVMLCFLFTDVPLKYRLPIGVILLLAGVTEVLTLSRGGWVALAFGGLVALYGIFKEKLKSKVKSFFAVSLSVLFLTLTILGLSQTIRDRLFEQDYGSAYSRIPMMMVAFNMIADNPFQGVGLNNYTTRMNLYDRTSANISYKFPWPVHNAFLIIAGESGLLALASFLLILFGAAAMAFSFFGRGDPLLSFIGIGFFSGLLTWIVHAQFKMDFAGVNCVLWFSLGMITALYRAISQGQSVSSHDLDPALAVRPHP
jgi:putative inorganic carbon (hco3(-)) transporter